MTATYMIFGLSLFWMVFHLVQVPIIIIIINSIIFIIIIIIIIIINSILYLIIKAFIDKKTTKTAYFNPVNKFIMTQLFTDITTLHLVLNCFWTSPIIHHPRTRWRTKWRALRWSLGLSRLKKTTIWISIESLMKMFFFYIFLTICMIKWSQVITIRLHGYTYFKSYIFMID